MSCPDLAQQEGISRRPRFIELDIHVLLQGAIVAPREHFPVTLSSPSRTSAHTALM